MPKPSSPSSTPASTGNPEQGPESRYEFCGTALRPSFAAHRPQVTRASILPELCYCLTVNRSISEICAVLRMHTFNFLTVVVGLRQGERMELLWR